MKKLLLVGLIASITLSFVGCFGSGEKDKVDGGDKPVVEEQEDSDEEKPDKEESGDKEDEPDKETVEKPKEPSTEKPKEPVEEEDNVKRSFPITTKDIDYNIIKGETVVTVGYGVAENIKEILKEISTEYFDNTSLELQDIETVKGKKIAVINLNGTKEYWHEKMQGSAGGEITEYTLVENILQRKYEGYWIDGVRFVQGSGNLEGSEHATKLTEITYR